MRNLVLTLTVLLMFPASAAFESHVEVPVLKAVHQVKRSAVHNAPTAADVVLASWYGEQFAGRKTANGEIFDPYGMTGASRTIKLGSRVLVTCLKTQKSVVIRINDRGPWIKNHDGKYTRGFDLSRGVAQALGMEQLGVARVSYTILRS
jgi:rare lipoprotein A